MNPATFKLFAASQTSGRALLMMLSSDGLSECSDQGIGFDNPRTAQRAVEWLKQFGAENPAVYIVKFDIK
jgi:hypothetical protein